jgi:hypothetical protein
METGEFQAGEVLDDLLSTYYKLGDSAKLNAQAALFEPDGVVELHGRGEFVGREAIANAYRGPEAEPRRPTSRPYFSRRAQK